MKRLLIKTVLASVALTACGIASAQEVKTIKFATQNPKGHPLVAGMEKFKEIAEARSGSKLKVNLFPGGTLGSDQANVSALQGGTLEMVTMNSGILANQVKEFAIWDFPFMFGDPSQENPVAVIKADKFYEVQKHIVLSNHQYNPQSVMISRKFWDRLGASEKKIVADAAKYAVSVGQETVQELQAELAKVRQ
jgi:TRAP-type C4-dicarboxylate transport system substrate-binding protein